MILIAQTMRNKYSRKAVKQLKLDVDSFFFALNFKYTFKHNKPTQHSLPGFEVHDSEIPTVTQTRSETESALGK